MLDSRSHWIFEGQGNLVPPLNLVAEDLMIDSSAGIETIEFEEQVSRELLSIYYSCIAWQMH